MDKKKFIAAILATDIRKWNAEAEEYDPYEVPEWARIILYTEDTDQVIDCAGCFMSMKFGDSYTSRVLHNGMGLGFPVCEKCYYKEKV